MKADEDAYVILDDLRWRLVNRNPEALRKAGLREWWSRTCTEQRSLEICFVIAPLKAVLGRRMEILDAKPDSRDPTGKETFHPPLPKYHLIPGSLPRTLWWWKCNHYPPLEGPTRPSNLAVSCHYASATTVFELEYLCCRLH